MKIDRAYGNKILAEYMAIRNDDGTLYEAATRAKVYEKMLDKTRNHTVNVGLCFTLNAALQEMTDEDAIDADFASAIDCMDEKTWPELLALRPKNAYAFWFPARDKQSRITLLEKAIAMANKTEKK